MNTRFFELSRSGLGLVLALALAGCPASNGDPKDASDAAGEKRDTELTHEDCDIGAKSSVKLDANGDKRPDIIKVMDGQREACRAVDINMDTVIDVFIYYDDAGKTRRRESGFDRDSRPDEVAHYQGGVIVRRERETNNDGKIDTWDYYEAGKLVREERDSTGDGYVDQWWTFKDDEKCPVVVSDGDGDGKPDKDSQIDLCKDQKPAPPAAPKPDDAEKDDAEKKDGEPGDDAAGKPDDAGPTPGDGSGDEKDADASGGAQ